VLPSLIGNWSHKYEVNAAIYIWWHEVIRKIDRYCMQSNLFKPYLIRTWMTSKKKRTRTSIIMTWRFWFNFLYAGWLVQNLSWYAFDDLSYSTVAQISFQTNAKQMEGGPIFLISSMVMISQVGLDLVQYHTWK
jgi:hypothetical protein